MCVAVAIVAGLTRPGSRAWLSDTHGSDRATHALDCAPPATSDRRAGTSLSLP